MPPKLTLTEAFLKESLAENRRLRGEVRRLRRVIRDVRKCGCAGIGCHAELGAALAPRRRKKP